MPKPSTIAIDGPAGSGKSTISEKLAEKYGYLLIDTGAFYRAITYVIAKANVSPEDIPAVTEIINQLDIRIKHGEGKNYRVLANGEDVTDHLRSGLVEKNVSPVSKIPIVREAMLPLQRKVAEKGNVILAGRDIGTVVLPNADLKLYVDASPQERARRRHLQNIEAGKESDLATITAELERRDMIDSQRSLAPLVRADDAIYIQTDNKSIDEVIGEITYLIEQDC